MYQASLGLRVGHHHRIMSCLYIALTLLQIVLINAVQYNVFTKCSHPTCTGKLASEAKPPGSSQGVRGGWRGILLAPASWLLPDLLGVPKRPGDHPTHVSELASKAKPPGTPQEVRSGWGRTLLVLASWLSPNLLGFPKRPGNPSYSRQRAGFRSHTPWDFPRGQEWVGRNPTCAGKLAFAKPFGTSQKARSGEEMRKNTTYSPTSWFCTPPWRIPRVQG